MVFRFRSLVPILVSTLWFASGFVNAEPRVVRDLLEERVSNAIDETSRPYDYKSTKHADIVEWRDLPGGQYVLGLGVDEVSKNLVPFAVYDKTFPHPRYGRFWEMLFLGTWGINDINLANAVIHLKNRSQHAKDKKAEEYVRQLVGGDEDLAFHSD